MYRILIKKGLYLPAENSKCINENYLIDCANEKIFTIKISGLKLYLLSSDIAASCYALIAEIQKKTDKQMGFTESNLPDKNWLVNVLYTLDPKNQIFTSPVQELTRVLPKG